MPRAIRAGVYANDPGPDTAGSAVRPGIAGKPSYLGLLNAGSRAESRAYYDRAEKTARASARQLASLDAKLDALCRARSFPL